MRPAVDVTLADGRYRLEQRLGAGGMASVWLAVDERLGRAVAVKIVADTLAGDEHWVRRFRREARAAASLSHRGVVPVFDYGVEDGRPYLVMEYVPGGTLADRLASNSSAEARTAQHLERSPSRIPHPERLARELLQALAAVHAADILHRDVKPANLLLDGQGHVRLTDFGIAQPQDSTALTRTGMVVGTLRYLAPEVAAGRPASVQSDLYAAGVVIRQVAGARRMPALDALVAALTAEDPAQRPASARAALELLAVPAAQPRRQTSPSLPPADDAATRAMPADDRTPRLLSKDRTSVTRPLHSTRRRRPARPPRGLLAAIAVAAVLIVIVIAIGPGGGAGSSRSTAPGPAPAKASVTRQLQALQRIVVHAGKR
ncbi:MAG TPA: serine/threonine-protein kinase [Solirubrobacteraceae bacterium]|nr:serine/threonine-protein kinase [Solirubrobacteraceae bacterium]